MVNGEDLGVLVGAWGTSDPCADLSGDGLVRGADVGVLMGAWGACTVQVACVCAAADHGCFTTGGPGCADAGCCGQVCAWDLLCCQATWDAVCVDQAAQACPPPPDDEPCQPGFVNEPEPCGGDTNGGCDVKVVGDSTCCVAGGGPGCDDSACQATVCAFDPRCCAVGWDALCVEAAVAFCQGVCELTVPAFTPIACGGKVCGTAWANAGLRDSDWYRIEIAAGADGIPDGDLDGGGDSSSDDDSAPALGVQIAFSIQTTLPMLIGLMDTQGVPDCALTSFPNPFAVAGPLGSASFGACLGVGVHWLRVTPLVTNGFPCGTLNDYTITLECIGTCAPPGCGTSDHDCLSVGGPYCSDGACCVQVCDVEPFCCAAFWDGGCVNQASLLCYGICPEGGHGCFELGLPGCSDAECCAAVCAVEPICCVSAWSGVCVNEAFLLCAPPQCGFACDPDAVFEEEPCGADVNGGCGGPSPGFTDIACGERVCATAWAEFGFRDTDWYRLQGGRPGVATLSIATTLSMLIGLSGGVDCAASQQISPFATAALCGTAAIQFDYDGVEAWLLATPSELGGFACGTLNDYQIHLHCIVDPDGG